MASKDTRTDTNTMAAGDVAHDAADSGYPVKVGGKATTTALPTSVASADRTNLVTDRYGRFLPAPLGVDQGMVFSVAVEYTTAQTGSVVRTPTSGNRLVITSFTIGTGATTAALVTVFFDDDTTYTAGTDQALFRGVMTPTATATPGVVHAGPPLHSLNTNDSLRVTTDANITIYLQFWGYEVTP